MPLFKYMFISNDIKNHTWHTEALGYIKQFMEDIEVYSNQMSRIFLSKYQDSSDNASNIFNEDFITLRKAKIQSMKLNLEETQKNVGIQLTELLKKIREADLKKAKIELETLQKLECNIRNTQENIKTISNQLDYKSIYTYSSDQLKTYIQTCTDYKILTISKESLKYDRSTPGDKIEKGELATAIKNYFEDFLGQQKDLSLEYRLLKDISPIIISLLELPDKITLIEKSQTYNIGQQTTDAYTEQEAIDSYLQSANSILERLNPLTESIKIIINDCEEKKKKVVDVSNVGKNFCALVKDKTEELKELTKKFEAEKEKTINDPKQQRKFSKFMCT